MHKNFVPQVSPRVSERILKGDMGLEVSTKEVTYEDPYLIGDDALFNNRKLTHSIVTSTSSVILKIPVEAYSKISLDFGAKAFEAVESAANKKEIHLFENFISVQNSKRIAQTITLRSDNSSTSNNKLEVSDK
jgi:hypothetical protein